MSHYPADNSNPADSPDPNLGNDGTDSLYRKPLGRYLVESGLLSQSQLDIALRDQQYSGYPLGEILVLRGWVQESVIDLIVKKLQPVSDVTQSELRVVIAPGQTVTRGIVAKEGATTIVTNDDSSLAPWEQETTTIHRIGEDQDDDISQDESQDQVQNQDAAP
jgi:hypothetical protein